MNLFVVEDEYTYYLRLYILGFEPFCCVEYTYYLDEYLGYCSILFTFIYLRS